MEGYPLPTKAARTWVAEALEEPPDDPTLAVLMARAFDAGQAHSMREISDITTDLVVLDYANKVLDEIAGSPPWQN